MTRHMTRKLFINTGSSNTIKLMIDK